MGSLSPQFEMFLKIWHKVGYYVCIFGKIYREIPKYFTHFWWERIMGARISSASYRDFWYIDFWPFLALFSPLFGPTPNLGYPVAHHWCARWKMGHRFWFSSTFCRNCMCSSLLHHVILKTVSSWGESDIQGYYMVQNVKQGSPQGIRKCVCGGWVSETFKKLGQHRYGDTVSCRLT